MLYKPKSLLMTIINVLAHNKEKSEESGYQNEFN